MIIKNVARRVREHVQYFIFNLFQLFLHGRVRDDLRGASRSRGGVRRRRDSCPPDEVVGGFWVILSIFGPRRGRRE